MMTELYLEMRLLQRDGAYLIWAVFDHFSGVLSSKPIVFRGFQPRYVPYPPPHAKPPQKQKNGSNRDLKTVDGIRPCSFSV